MEIERRQAMTAKKFWNMVRAIALMLRKELSKGRIIMSDLHLMMKRGKLAGKAMFNLMHLHHTSGCRTTTDIAQSIAIAPQDYEFSCSNSPAFPALQLYGKRGGGKHHHRYDDVTTVSAVKRVLEMLNNQAAASATPAVEVAASPMVELAASPMVMFGKSPIVRVTDSPFPVKDDGDHKVDEAAEAFIKRFYGNLKQQRITAALESPSPYHRMWGR